MKLLAETSPEFFAETFERIDFGTYSDLHKDVYGFRPRNGEVWEQMTAAAQSDEIGYLVAELAHVLEAEAEAERAAIVTLDDRLEGYGVDFATAIRWEMQAHDLRMNSQDLGYFLYLNGIHKIENTRRYEEAANIRRAA